MMNFDPQHFVQGLIPIVFVAFILYRRFRRNFGRQKLNRGYMIFRMVVLCAVGALLLIPAFFSTLQALATVLGVGIGVGLALWAARHTRFLNQDGMLYYIPHTYTGIVVSALFLGRIIYKVLFVTHSSIAVGGMEPQTGLGDLGGFSSLYSSPLSSFIFFILIGYYVYYYWFVLHESQHLKPGDMETSTKSP